ncbi:mitochondrial chaperone bcs1 [Moniliophthora roreri MCA 2997]|uniref:Mitochondrial chaperone bcs1 n=2 Tax=Moniliophthora roreri TaxID=221103 RepID=V2WY41_MONRO|nr:mitochondrial chaperone bcs1 [Moniliophthora roreri MCA 2997]KAI3605064.1 mitochondrial chaperone bcs1 [Moniliophthora roreri]
MAEGYLQQILQISEGVKNSAFASNATAPSPSNGFSVNDISALISFLFSFTALRDWVKLIVIGGFFETCRRFIFTMYSKAISSFWMYANFEQDDPSYQWMMVWLSQQPSWKKTRDVSVSTNTFGAANGVIQLDGEDTYQTTRQLSYQPSLFTSYTLWYKGRYMQITRTQEDSQPFWGHRERTLHISILTRSHKLLVSLLQEARDAYLAAQEHSMSVYTSDINNNWRHVASRSKRSMRSIILDPGIKDMLFEDAREFLDSKTWYSERGIPFRRGYLLHGAPGSGKTSLIHSMAGELGLDVYIITLSRAGLDDTALNELINQLPQRCVALMEDIDAAFTHGLSRDAPAVESSPGSQKPSTPGGPQAPPTTNKLSLSGLLNALDGVGAQEGRILFATTNKYSSLDPALCRPGRMDLHIEFRNASKYQAEELFARFYKPEEDLKKDSEENGSSDKSSDSGYGSAEDPEKLELELRTGQRSHRHRAPSLSNEELRGLAKEFAGDLQEREFSMAALQGYLMLYKTRPVEAVKNFKDWAGKEKEEKTAKEKEKAVQETKEKEEKAKETMKEDDKDKLIKEIREDIERKVQEALGNGKV